MKRILFLIIVLISITSINVSAKNYEYVSDEYNILKKDTKDYIEEYSKYIYEEAGIEYYVVLTDGLGDYDLDTYSKIVYDNIVSNKNDKGLLILISKDDRMVKITAGSGISDVITNEVINDYLKDYFIPFLSTNEWDNGIINGYTAIYKCLCYNLYIDTSGLEVINGNDFLFKYRFYIFFVCIFICNLIGCILPKFFVRFFDKDYKVKFMDMFIFLTSIFINVIILYYSYSYTKNYLYILLVFELFSIYSGILYYKRKRHIKKR